MTIRELKNFINSVSDNCLDQKIVFSYEDNTGYKTISDAEPTLCVDEWDNFCFIISKSKESKEEFHLNPTLWNEQKERK